MHARVISTARLRLEAAHPRHLDSMRVAIESSLPEIRRWMWWAIDDSPEQTNNFLEGSARAWDSDTAWNFAITFRNEVIGGAGIDTYLPLRSSAELGYWLATPHTGQGLMTEAASALVTFAFEDLKLHRLQLHAAVENIASQRVAEKVGFRRMGRCGTQREVTAASTTVISTTCSRATRAPCR